MTRPESIPARQGVAWDRRALCRALLVALAVVALALLTAPALEAQGNAGAGPHGGGAQQGKHEPPPHSELAPHPTTVARGESTVGFWAGEDVPGTDWKNPDTYWNRRATRLYTPQLWNVLRRYRVPLYFNLRYRRDFGPIPPGKPHRNDALRLVRTANRHGVPVWAWILIPYSSGYWAWEGAATEHLKAVKALVNWAREKKVRLKGLVLDLEPPLNFPFQATAVTMGSGAEFPPLFRQTILPGVQCGAWRGYLHIARWAENHGVSLSASPIAAALDDIEDHRLALEDAAQFVLPPAPWHELFFQVYRSVFAYYDGYDPGPGIISSYLHSARRAFGADVGQVSLGSAGRGPYKRLSALLHDVRLAATLGASEVPIYSLERTLRSYGGPASILRLVHAADHPFRADQATEATAPTRKSQTLRSTVRNWDAAAVTATHTPLPTTGALPRANSWPNGCGTK